MSNYNRKISQMTARGSLDGTEKIPVVLPSGTDKNQTITPEVFRAWLFQNAIEGGVVVVIPTPPTDANDFTTFPGGVAPSFGYFEALSTTKLWRFKAGWTSWRHATLSI